VPTGSVKWFNTAKGFGFISVEDGADVFVHQSNIADATYGPLRDGQPVEFEVGAGPKGPEAGKMPKQKEKTEKQVKPSTQAQQTPKVKTTRARNKDKTIKENTKINY